MTLREFIATATAAIMLTPAGSFAASHREAPLTALDHPADITDFYAFVSYDDPTKVTFLLNVDPLLEPANGPNYFPFDPDILYTIKIDNDYDGVEDVTFEVRFQTEIRAPGVFTGFVGAGTGIAAPANAPGFLPATGTGNLNSSVGASIVPPAVTALDGKGSEGLSLRQTYTVTLVRGCAKANVTSPTPNPAAGTPPGQAGCPDASGNPGTPITGPAGTAFSAAPGVRTDLGAGKKLIAVPSNVGPRTMPSYAPDPNALTGPQTCTTTPTALACQGIYDLGNGIRVFAGTVDDPFYIDLGAAFDSLNFRSGSSFLSLGGVLSALQDLNDTQNYAPDAVAGYNVNTIAIEVPIRILTNNTTIGAWGATYRPQMTVRRSPDPTATTPVASIQSTGQFYQVQRMGNPLINELIIGTGAKDTWSLSQPKDEGQFASYFLDPLLAHVINAVYGVTVPDPPRNDLLPLVQYLPPLVATGTTKGPIADLLRLNVTIKPTAAASRKRLGFIAGDSAGFPNGRRVSDDVTDIAARAVAGVLCGVTANCTANGIAFLGTSAPLIGDGVNTNDQPYQETFPYVAFANSGRNSRHVGSGQKGCTATGTQICPQE